MSRKAAGPVQLIDIAKEGGRDRRGELFRGVAGLFLAAPERCSDEALAHVDAILSALAEHVEPEARRDIAHRLAGTANAPKSLMRKFALDDIAVAEPVLKKCRALEEDDLLLVIAERGQAHRSAIAARKGLSPRLAAEIVRRGEKAALIALAGNREARLAPETMEELVARARGAAELQPPLTRRLDLPPALLTQMYFFVSSALKKEILRRSETLDPALVERAVGANRRSIIALIEAGCAPAGLDASDFIRSRIVKGSVTESLMRSLIAERRIDDFAIAFSYYAGVDAASGRRILADPSSQAFAIACRASRIDRAVFAPILFGLPHNAGDQRRAVKILDLYLKIPEEAAERMMRFWRMRAASPAEDAEEEYGGPAIP